MWVGHPLCTMVQTGAHRKCLRSHEMGVVPASCCCPLDPVHFDPSQWKRPGKEMDTWQQHVQGGECSASVVSAPGNFGIIWYSVQSGCCGGVNVLPVTSILLAQRFLTPPVPGHERDDLPPFGAADAQVWFHLSRPLADLRRQSQADFANSFLWSGT